MKTTVKRAIGDEQGHVLIMALILLVVGGLILTPLLGLMSTGLVAGQVYEKKTDELYAADAGVEDAIWRIQNRVPESYPYSYPEPLTEDPFIVNGKSVEVEILRVETDESTQCRKVYRYQIGSNATGTDGGTTTVEAFLVSVGLNYSALAGNAITSGGDVTILGQKTSISGNILLAEDGTLNVPGDFEHIDGQVVRADLEWPDGDELADFYFYDVRNAPSYYGDTIIDLRGKHYPTGPVYINGKPSSSAAGLGPLYVDGNLEITNSENPRAELTLAGTLYVTGTLLIKPTKDLIINLDGNTIFVGSPARKPPESREALYVGGQCGINGPGTIVVVGDIHFEPQIEAGKTDPVLIYSVSGKTDVWPKGAFYGSIVGNVQVDLQPNNTIVYPGGGFGLINFPGLIEGKERYTLESWQIK